MLEILPFYIYLLFIVTIVATLSIFYWVMKSSDTKTTQKNAIKIVLFFMVWLGVQAVLTLNNVYSLNINSMPPKIFLLGVLPNFLFIIILFFTKKGSLFIDSLPIKNLTYMHLVRIPVEFVLWWLFLNKTIPEVMTFEGRNFDIIAGITAPIVAYFGITKNTIRKPFILIWNFICLGLLINIGVIGFLSAPTPLQKFAFDQPNIALLHFPFSWLVSFIVPMVLFAHLVSIRQLLQGK